MLELVKRSYVVMQIMKRLTFLAGLLIVVGACAPAPERAPADEAALAVSPLQMVVASDDFAAGQTRVPFILYSGSDRVTDARRVTVTLFDLSRETPQPGWQGEATNYSDYEVPYWIIYADFPHAGYWGLGAEIELADGSRATAQLAVQVKEQSNSPGIGQRVPASENRTLATEPDIRKLTSDFDEPEPALYQMTVAEAMTLGRPAVVSFSTPAFCTSQVCGPVVTTVKEVYHDLAEHVSFIHIEVYKEFEPLVLADEVTQWQLTSEPWTFVLDRDGRVVARLGGPVSPRELQAALLPLLP
jgi:hypothetical protein